MGYETAKEGVYCLTVSLSGYVPPLRPDSIIVPRSTCPTFVIAPEHIQKSLTSAAGCDRMSLYSRQQDPPPAWANALPRQVGSTGSLPKRRQWRTERWHPG